jgi:hypothetical protein
VTDDIFRYDLSTDTITVVGKMPSTIYAGSVTSDGAGNFYYFGGTPDGGSSYNYDVIRFSSQTGETSKVGWIMRTLFRSPVVQINNHTALILGSQHYEDPAVFRYDTATNNVKLMPFLPQRYSDSGVFWNERDGVAIVFGKKKTPPAKLEQVFYFILLRYILKSLHLFYISRKLTENLSSCTIQRLE